VVLVAGGSLFSTTVDWAVEDANLTPIPIQIPLPERPETLSDIQALLQRDGDDCQLLCFWGFRPEHSTKEEAFEFLQPEPVGPNEPELIYSFTDPNSQERLFSLSFGTQDQLVKSISVIIREPDNWLPDETLQLQHLLSTLPPASEVYLSINITTQSAFLTLAYDEGVLADYVFELQMEGPSLQEADFSFCTSISSNKLIKLQLRDADAQTLLEGYGLLDESVQDTVWTIDRMIGMSAEEFVIQVIDNPDGCIDIYSYAELSEMGYGGF
jgi:hypothetical protein